MERILRLLAVAVVSLAVLTEPAGAQEALKAKDGNRYKEIVYEPGYEHDKWQTLPRDHVFAFRAYVTSFDGKDDNDGDVEGNKRGVPEWVAFEIRRKEMEIAATRPSP